MSSNLRMVLAIGLSAVVLFLYMFYQAKTAPVPTAAPSTVVEGVEPKQQGLDIGSLQKVEPLLRESGSQNVVLENDIVRATFENGVLISYVLKDFTELASGNGSNRSENIDMVEQVYSNTYPFTISFQTLSNSMILPNTSQYTVENKNAQSVTFSADFTFDGEPIVVKKSFSLTDLDYQLKNTVSIENKGEKDIPMFYSYVLGTGIGPYRVKRDATREDATRSQYLRADKKTATRLLEGTITKESLITKIFGFGRGKEPVFQYKSYKDPMNWVSLNNRYFAIISGVPSSSIMFEAATFSYPETNLFRNDFHMADLVISHSIPKGGAVTDEYPVYIGPKSRALFANSYSEESYQSLFQESFLGLNLRPLTYVLDIILGKLYQFTRSYALAIILFTFLFKVITFPLTQASYKSMKKMQLMNPKIERIKEQYKDSPEKMNAEIMSIYKKEKINPLGGCLPMLLPFPLLIAFFYLMQSMVELRNAPFLWISDLSSPDKLFVFAETLPIIGGFNFNLLPIIMAATSFLSMKLQPSSGGSGAAGKQMQMMSTIFPLMMLFMFYNFASGLALYWTAQNVFGILQQYLTSKLGKTKEAERVALVEAELQAKKKKKKRK